MLVSLGGVCMNWYLRDNLGKTLITRMCWQGWWTDGDIKILRSEKKKKEKRIPNKMLRFYYKEPVYCSHQKFAMTCRFCCECVSVSHTHIHTHTHTLNFCLHIYEGLSVSFTVSRSTYSKLIANNVILSDIFYSVLFFLSACITMALCQTMLANYVGYRP